MEIISKSSGRALCPTKNEAKVPRRKAKKMTRDDALAAVLAQNEGRHLGDLCGWSLSGTINQEEARRIADELGLGDDFQFPKLSPNSAYRRAVRKAVQSGARDEERYEAVKVEDTADKIVHSIVRKDVISKFSGTISLKDAGFQTEAQVAFNKRTQSLDMDKPHHIVEQVKYFYQELCVVFKPDDVRVAFQRAFNKWGGIRMLDSGGLWWVPAPYAERVRLWKEFMERTRNSTLILPVFDTQETVEGLRRMTEETIEGQLEKIKTQLLGFADREDTTRTSTLEARVQRFDELRDKAELYERLLGHNMASLKQQVAAAQRSLVESLRKIGA